MEMMKKDQEEEEKHQEWVEKQKLQEIQMNLRYVRLKKQQRGKENMEETVQNCEKDVRQQKNWSEWFRHAETKQVLKLQGSKLCD